MERGDDYNVGPLKKDCKDQKHDPTHTDTEKVAIPPLRIDEGDIPSNNTDREANTKRDKKEGNSWKLKAQNKYCNTNHEPNRKPNPVRFRVWASEYKDGMNRPPGIEPHN